AGPARESAAVRRKIRLIGDPHTRAPWLRVLQFRTPRSIGGAVQRLGLGLEQPVSAITLLCSTYPGSENLERPIWANSETSVALRSNDAHHTRSHPAGASRAAAGPARASPPRWGAPRARSRSGPPDPARR